MVGPDVLWRNITDTGFPETRAVILKSSPFVLKVKLDHAAPHLCIDLALWRGISFFLLGKTFGSKR
jgi:hypothetical protein